MTELGEQRLIISRELGSDLANVLENKPSSGELRETLINLTTRVKDQLSINPNTKIIGTSLNEQSTLLDIIASINRQMGLPPNSNLGDIRNRLAGREKDFILIFPGANRLPERTKNTIAGKIKKLKIPIFWEE